MGAICFLYPMRPRHRWIKEKSSPDERICHYILQPKKISLKK